MENCRIENENNNIELENLNNLLDTSSIDILDKLRQTSYGCIFSLETTKIRLEAITQSLTDNDFFSKLNQYNQTKILECFLKEIPEIISNYPEIFLSEIEVIFDSNFVQTKLSFQSYYDADIQVSYYKDEHSGIFRIFLGFAKIYEENQKPSLSWIRPRTNKEQSERASTKPSIPNLN